MKKSQLSRKDFFKKFSGMTLSVAEIKQMGPEENDPLFEKYSRKTLGPRQYSQQMDDTPPIDGPDLSNRIGNITSGLNPYIGTWNVWQVNQLLRRLSFGVTKADKDALLSLTPSAAVDVLMSVSPLSNPSPTALNDYQAIIGDSGGIAAGESWTSNNLTYAVTNPNDNSVNNYRERSLTAWSWGVMLNDPTSIREKMVQFWYHFIPINIDDIGGQTSNAATLSNDYFNLLRNHALGNFKTLIKEIAKAPAMLIYLGNQFSTATVPNENFARELMELFTMGKVPTQNYTEPDIIAASKVFSGWRVTDYRMPYPFVTSFNSGRHNQTDKVFSGNFNNTTIYNQIGANGAIEFDLFFDMLFTEQQLTIAKYLSRRLYRFFVYYDIDANIETNVIEPLAAFVISSNWDMDLVLKKLFKSEHFFDVANKGVQIKNPIDFIAGTLRTLKINTTSAAGGSQLVNQYTVWRYFHNYANTNLEQGYGLVPNVSGWKAYYQEPTYFQNWINSSTIQKRASLLTSFINGFTTGSTLIKFDPIAFVQQFPNAIIQDADLLIEEIVPILFSVDLPAQFKTDTKIATLLGGQITNNYWTTAWNNYAGTPTNTGYANIVRTRLNSLISSFIQLAEFQLM